MRCVVVGLLATLAAACFSKPPRPGSTSDDAMTDAPVADAWLGDYDFRKRIRLDSPVEIADFPAGVTLVADADLEQHARTDGRDIVVTADDGETILPAELAAYDAGSLELWVRVPELSSTTAIYLYYGGDDATPNREIWSGPFAGVWHLSDPQGGTALDSTTNANAMTATSGRIPSRVDGVFGGAREMDGVDDSLDAGDPATGTLDFGTGSFSYSLWVFQLELVGDFDSPFYKGGMSLNEPGYCWLLGTPWTAKLQQGTNVVDPEFSSPVLGQWVHLAAVVDRDAGTFTVYKNGMQADSKSLGAIGSLSTAEPMQLGRDGGQEPFRGRLDEVRIYSTALTADWVRGEHANGSPGFLSVGNEERRP